MKPLLIIALLKVLVLTMACRDASWRSDHEQLVKEAELGALESRAFCAYREGNDSLSIANYQRLVTDLEKEQSQQGAKGRALRLWLAYSRLSRSLERAGRLAEAQEAQNMSKTLHMKLFPEMSHKPNEIQQHLEMLDEKQHRLLDRRIP